MSENYQVVRIIPDKKGKGGDKSGMTTHMGVVDIYSNTNAMIYAGRWRNVANSAAYTTGAQNNANASQCMQVHVYYRYSTSPTAEPTTYLLGHHYEGSSGNYDVLWCYSDSNYVQCFKNSTVYTGFATPGSTSVTGVVPSPVAGDLGRRISIWGLNATDTGFVLHRFTVAGVGGSTLTLSAPYDGYPPGGTQVAFVMAQRVWNVLQTPTSIAKFVNVKNRCFIAWGNTYWGNLIFDTSYGGTTPTIAYQMGIPAPTSNIVGYTIYTPYYGFGGVTNDSNFSSSIGVNKLLTPLALPSGTPPIPPNLTISIAGGLYTAAALYNTNQTVSVAVAADGVSFTATGTQSWYAVGTAMNLAPGNFQRVIGDLTVVAGVISGHLTQSVAQATYGSTTLYACNFTITPPYASPPSSNLSWNGNVATNGLQWSGQGPTYAVARYNPITGHVSNIGPQLAVTEQGQNPSIITLTIPTDGIASDYFQAGYTKLIVFRTQFAYPGGSLLPIGDPTVDSLGVTDKNGTINNYPDSAGFPGMGSGNRAFFDTYADSVLLTASTFVAPQATNNPPPTFCQMAYWDSCVWGVDVADQTAIRRSGYGVGEIKFGVAEESFPSLDQLRIPAEDGRVLGMKPVGGSLIITTQRYSYSLTGSQGNYALVRFCTSMFGVTHERFCEWAGDAGEASDRLAFIGNDAKLYRFTPGYGTEVVSMPIASNIDQYGFTGANLSAYRVHQLVSKGYRLFVFRMDQVYVLDYENGTWHIISPFVTEAFTQIYSSIGLPIQLFGYRGTLYKWFDDTIGDFRYATLQTFTIDGGSPETFKELIGVRIWVSNPTGYFSGTAYSDEGVVLSSEPRSVALTFAAEQDLVRAPQNAGIFSKLDNINASTLVAYTGVPFPGHRFYVTLSFGTAPTGHSATQTDIYEIDILFKLPEGPQVP
jgi:hypothetical protein